MNTKQFTKEDYEMYLKQKTPAFVSLVAEVLEDPSYWTEVRFVNRYRQTPRTPGSKHGHTPSRGKKEWQVLINHGLL